MTIADVCKVYQVSERTVRRWIADGRLPAVIDKGVTHVSHYGAALAYEEWQARRGTRRARPPRLT